MMERNIFEEITEFLEYLGKNSYNQKVREKKSLIEKFGEKKFNRTFNLCFDNHFVGYDLPLENYFIHATPEGLKFLGEENHKRIIQEHNKTTLYLTTILVLTTILSAFLAIKLVNPLLLIVIYSVVILIVTIIFKTNKIIKV